jgi:two-component system response regulator RegX3
VRRRILIVEDEPLIADSVAFALEREAFEVEVAPDGATALAKVGEKPWDLVILDLGLPDRSGLDVCRDLRGASPVPIVILTARDAEYDRVIGLEAGSDDYLVKPFSMAELVARVRAQLRRRDIDRAETSANVRHLGGLTLDLSRRQVLVDGVAVHLANAEFTLLALLSEHSDHVVSRRAIVERLWSGTYVGDTRVCDTYVARLRKKIELDSQSPVRILTVRGHGYRLVTT